MSTGKSPKSIDMIELKLTRLFNVQNFLGQFTDTFGSKLLWTIGFSDSQYLLIRLHRIGVQNHTFVFLSMFCSVFGCILGNFVVVSLAKNVLFPQNTSNNKCHCSQRLFAFCIFFCFYPCYSCCALIQHQHWIISHIIIIVDRSPTSNDDNDDQEKK